MSIPRNWAGRAVEEGRRRVEKENKKKLKYPLATQIKICYNIGVRLRRTQPTQDTKQERNEEMKKAKFKEGDAIVTKTRLALEVRNDMCHNFYYEIRFRVYANEHHYFKGNFVVWFDTEDLAEFYDKDTFTKKDIKEYVNMLAVNFLDSAPRKNVNAKTLKPFYEECRFTIMDYNEKRRVA